MTPVLRFLKSKENKFSFRVQTEIFSSIAKQDYYLKPQITDIHFELPDSLFVDGIAVFQEDSSSCEETEIG